MFENKWYQISSKGSSRRKKENPGNRMVPGFLSILIFESALAELYMLPN
jgi:hypothetical protein